MRSPAHRPVEPEPLLLEPREAARMLRISERTLNTYTMNGTLPVTRIGRSVRYSPDALRAWIAKQEGGGAA
jgi:excisionase family DNA binding protein